MTRYASPRGRGASFNPPNRFEQIVLEPDPEWLPGEEERVPTVLLRDTTQTIITHNDSPDVGFETGVNPYRGCEHGCAYCFARPTHEYLGFSSGLDFESRIVVKERAPELLRRELSSKRWKPQVIAMSGVTDCYQPVERRLQITRRCLEVLAEFKNPVCIITKSHLVTRDIDLLSDLARCEAAAVFISVTSLDSELARKLEPRAASPELRLNAIAMLSGAGVPVGVLVAPVIPAITDHEMPAILKAAVSAGATFAGYVPLRLPYALKGLFDDWLKRHFPDRREKVLNQLRSMRDGKLNDPQFGSRMRGSGPLGEQLEQIFHVSCRRAGIGSREAALRLSTSHFRVPPGPQLTLF